MKKTLSIIIALFAVALTASAQFEKGQGYVGASVTGLDLSYNGSRKLNIGLDAQAGLFCYKDVLLYGRLGWQHNGKPSHDDIRLGAGGRYYIEQNGIFLGLSANYVHQDPSSNDFRPGFEVGYCFFVTNQVAVEPALYYEQSTHDHSNLSTVGIKVGIGLYRNAKKVRNDIKSALQ